ncbi:LppP/LprE family lipoprotein [Nocardia sp. NBC_01503]|uniref:LppP/LprE family lipoprotein n=1 Tax=Nocardia sp. NBC_01503 TaxID=2975997 RepID=UPI002E7BDF06|nr:LppP/LprE family lipoprotein [Nocardia sp. NBC_01503]WTL30509.1 LppP/LprE family lipoprotein [Nocardia sp. NBC_01503]
MKATTAVLAAGLTLALSGCGSTTTQSAAPSTTRSVSAPASAPATQTTRPTQPVDQSEQPGTQPGQTDPGGGIDAPAVEPAPASTVTEKPAPQTATTIAAPNGSGHGLCFDVNSALADQAIKRLAATASGPWQVEGGSNDAIADGCDGVLSYLIVTSGNIHPYTHILYFTNGTYLGTATSKPYGYTTVTGKTRTTVSVDYRWIKSDEPLCCPAGGPSTVTFTLTGTTVHANGQFPPN